METWHIHTLNGRVENRMNEPYTTGNVIKITSNGQNLRDMTQLVYIPEASQTILLHLRLKQR